MRIFTVALAILVSLSGCAAGRSNSTPTAEDAKKFIDDVNETVLKLALDSSQGYADRPGLRAGFSFPYRPFHLAERRPLDLVELPMAVMDATLAERRYLGLEPRAGLERTLRLLERVADIGGTVAILWHTDRFSREYARGWDRAYADVLEWVAARGGRLVTAADAVAAG